MRAELVIDNFAGGGGASTGIEAGIGRPVDYAINHDPEAIAMHRANHPATHHLQTGVWDVNPRALVGQRRVGLGWFSPDCTFHSKARGGKPFRDRNLARRRRGLAWLIPYWMKAVRPRVIMLENVEEFADWGPLLEDGSICPARRGMTFRRWHAQLENLGYQVDMRQIRACDYGAPTIRRRLFVIARCDGGEIVFPEATHGFGSQPYRTAAECIDWSIPCPSIFERKRPLAEATLRRIAAGVMRYCVNAANPFIVPVTHGGDARVHSISDPLRTITTANGGEFALAVPTLIQAGYGERPGQAPRVPGLDKPLGTVVAGGGKHALVTAFLAKHFTGVVGADLLDPMPTVTATDHNSLVTAHIAKLRGDNIGHATDEPPHTISAGGTHFAEVRAFLVAYYGTNQDARPDRPLHTITTRDRFGLVTVSGIDYRIVDIGMRMLTPRELFRAQGFPDSYEIEIQRADGKMFSKADQVRMCGNSVSPPVAEALVRANFADRAELREAA